MQNNQLPAKSQVELEDNSYVMSLTGADLKQLSGTCSICKFSWRWTEQFNEDIIFF
jgi:hypothetical protein